ncbi:hypothetical protein H257_13664 [Aphanomyces astaci]|uniref:MSP domain-containing protein n=1 Tax=Aphanomyces astaci TaxID=112090 RepID=W4FVR3_APHAT|nr:hypothetical protein H257_13664 [Aphanomyces astaci]ETV70909.1 hypothetical protein H257_13664 [Aphanomyces astaci]|eukprot:XP_009839572.1 hypothetical protein H257_13664 [Aphanomyces astaci]
METTPMPTEGGGGMPAALDITPRPCPFDFVLGDRTKRSLHLHNPSFHVPLHFKIQCNVSSRFRLQPSKGMLQPRGTITVYIQLSPQMSTEADCVFLVLSVPSPDNSVDDDVWKRGTSVMISKQYISSRIVNVSAPDKADEVRPSPPPPSEPPLVLAPPSLIMTLLMKNKSKHPTNQLTASEIACLRHRKLHTPSDEWSNLMSQAATKRKLLQKQRQFLATAQLPPPVRPFPFNYDTPVEVLSPPDSPCRRSDTSATSFPSNMRRLSHQVPIGLGERSGSTTCSSSSTCDSTTGSRTLYEDVKGDGSGPNKDTDDEQQRQAYSMWTRYMLDVCVQQLEQVDEVCGDLVRDTSQSEKAQAKLLALKKSAHTLVKLCHTSPFLLDGHAQGSSCTSSPLSSRRSQFPSR